MQNIVMTLVLAHFCILQLSHKFVDPQLGRVKCATVIGARSKSIPLQLPSTQANGIRGLAIHKDTDGAKFWLVMYS